MKSYTIAHTCQADPKCVNIRGYLYRSNVDLYQGYPKIERKNPDTGEWEEVERIPTNIYYNPEQYL